MTYAAASSSVLRALALASIAALTIACSFEQRSSGPTAPSPGDAGGLMGVWSSASVGIPSADSCTDAQWQVTSSSGNTVSGNFSATCAGGFKANGTGTATLESSSIAWNAAGNASQDGVTCPFALNGVALPETATTIRIDYSGTVCAVAVKGTERLTRR